MQEGLETSYGYSIGRSLTACRRVKYRSAMTCTMIATLKYGLVQSVLYLLSLVVLAVTVYCEDVNNLGGVAAAQQQHRERREDKGTKGLETYVIVIIVVSAVVALLVLVCLIGVFAYCCKRRRKSSVSRKHRDVESQPLIAKTTKERKREVQYEKSNSKAALKHYVTTQMRQYEQVEELPDMGSRMQKYWFKGVTYVESKGPDVHVRSAVDVVLTITPISRHCPLLPLNEETLKQLNDLMGKLKQHQFIQPTERIGYVADRKQAIVVQPFVPSGSLKDIIYGVRPVQDWADKYPMCSSGRSLSVDTVAKYGWQILKAMRFLYKQGFPIIGHVQSGNIFVQDGVCRLGGYENTLLGYRSRFYRMCQNYLDHMDVIMFGHLVFEMSCGQELVTLAPTEDNYQTVKDKQVNELLRFIFAKKFPYNIKAIKAHEFFKAVSKSEKEKPGQGKLKLKQQVLKEALTSVMSQLVYNKIWDAVKHGQEDEADKHTSPSQRRQKPT